MVVKMYLDCCAVSTALTKGHVDANLELPQQYNYLSKDVS